MSDFFHQLSPAELERLALLSEELGEAQHIVGKIIRHGYESCNPNDPMAVTNRGLLEQELGDVRAAVVLLFMNGDLELNNLKRAQNDKLRRVGKYLHYDHAGLPPA